MNIGEDNNKVVNQDNNFGFQIIIIIKQSTKIIILIFKGRIIILILKLIIVTQTQDNENKIARKNYSNIKNIII